MNSCQGIKSHPVFQFKDGEACYFNPLPNDKILDWSKLKAFADDKMNLAEKLKLLPGRVENIVGKGENADTSIFSFSHNVFKSFLFRGR